MKKKYYALSLSALLLLGASSCTEEKVGSSENLPNLRNLSVPEQELVQTSNAFAFDIFKAVEALKKEQNIFISPLSISIALHMTVNGAEGNTKAAMKEVLGVSQLSDAEANQAVEDLTDLLLSMDKKVALSIANSIWYRIDLNLHGEYSQLIEQQYDGRIEGLDFGNADAAKNTINSWVEQKTHGKIKDLIESISPDHVMFLVNAIYFKADWQYTFDKSQTKNEPFFVDNGAQVSVPLMYSKGVKLRTHTEEKFRLLDIPYGNGQYNMTILLPHENFTTEDVMAELNAASFAQWISQADTFSTELYLPKFKSDFKMQLNEPLADTGMDIAFSHQADFGGFFQEELSLQISEVIHQSFIEVNEEGTEAAAATAVGIKLTSVGPETPPFIKVDRSFIYLIREQHSGAILFAGKMLNPGS